MSNSKQCRKTPGRKRPSFVGAVKKLWSEMTDDEMAYYEKENARFLARLEEQHRLGRNDNK